MSVDLSRIAMESTVPTNKRIDPPRTPRFNLSVTKTLPAIPMQAISDPSHASSGSVLATIELQQQESLRALERRLRDFYQSHIDAFRLLQQQQLDKGLQSSYEKARDEIHTQFLIYASERGPKVARLAFLAGWPDSNPTSEPPRARVKPYMDRLLDEAKSLRAQIAALDQEFDAQAKAILQKVLHLSDSEKEAMATRIALYRDQLNRQAEREARAQVPTNAKELGLRLTEPNPVVVAALPERTVSVSVETPLVPAPKVPSEGILDGPSDRRRSMIHELDIWLGINRYRIAKGGQDVTEDFRRWRQSYQAGR